MPIRPDPPPNVTPAGAARSFSRKKPDPSATRRPSTGQIIHCHRLIGRAESNFGNSVALAVGVHLFAKPGKFRKTFSATAKPKMNQSKNGQAPLGLEIFWTVDPGHRSLPVRLGPPTLDGRVSSRWDGDDLPGLVRQSFSSRAKAALVAVRKDFQFEKSGR